MQTEMLSFRCHIDKQLPPQGRAALTGEEMGDLNLLMSVIRRQTLHFTLLKYTEWSRKNCTKFNAPSFCNRLQ